MCNSPPRAWLIFVLTIWLLLTTARQVFDLIGKLWVPVAFNLLQMLSCISGLFAACQRRMYLLIALTVSSVISTVYNILIILWYNGLLGDRGWPVLSAGLPYSYSFFLRHTPFCKSHFNLSSSQWVQSPCALPFYHIETIQAALHIIVAIATLILSTILFYDRRSRKRCGDNNKRKHPRITVEFSGGPNVARQPKVPNPPDSINDVDSGYMNSSYDDGVEREVNADPRTVRPPNGYARQSARRQRAKAARIPGSNGAQRKRGKSSSGDFSNCTTMEASNPNNGRHSRNSNKETTRQGARSAYLDEDWSDYEDPYSKPKTRTGSIKSFKLAATQGVRRMLSSEQLTGGSSFEGRSGAHRSSGSNLTSLVSFDPKSNTLIRVREHIDDGTDDDIYAGTSHVVGTSTPIKVPEMDAPLPPLSTRHLDLSGSDSGRPSSSNGYQGYTMVGNYPIHGDRFPTPPDRQNTQAGYDPTRPGTSDGYESARCNQPIGYEPALCDPIQQYERDLTRAAGIPLSYDPIYKSIAQVPGQRRNNIGHYHDPTSLRLMAYETEPRGAPSAVPIINNNGLLV